MAWKLLCVVLLAGYTSGHSTGSDSEVSSCKGYTCEPGHRCYLEEVKCRKTSCHKEPICRPICPFTPCDSNYSCVDGECYPLDSCDDYKCLNGQECYMKESHCENPPCSKNPSCRPSCQVIRCRAGFICRDGKCVEEPMFHKCALILCQEGFYCDNGKCVAEPTCDGVKCNEGEECHVEIVACFVSPCPPVPTCRPIDKCALIRCQKGFSCVDGRCVPEHSCDGFQCESGEECYLQEVQCIQAPCPPIPSCRPILTCATINCITGYVCVDRKCVPQPTCEGFQCDAGKECYLQQNECTSLPCSLATPVCRQDPCATIRCREGYICVDGQCILRNTTCVGFDECSPGEDCYLQSIQCFVAPCPPPFPACRPSCAAIQCLAPSDCVNGQCIPIQNKNELHKN